MPIFYYMKCCKRGRNVIFLVVLIKTLFSFFLPQRPFAANNALVSDP
jgi:hypothetical protein